MYVCDDYYFTSTQSTIIFLCLLNLFTNIYIISSFKTKKIKNSENGDHQKNLKRKLDIPKFNEIKKRKIKIDNPKEELQNLFNELTTSENDNTNSEKENDGDEVYDYLTLLKKSKNSEEIILNGNKDRTDTDENYQKLTNNEIKFLVEYMNENFKGNVIEDLIKETNLQFLPKLAGEDGKYKPCIVFCDKKMIEGKNTLEKVYGVCKIPDA